MAPIRGDIPLCPRFLQTDFEAKGLAIDSLRAGGAVVCVEGLGRTCLQLALAESSSVHQSYRDGVLWMKGPERKTNDADPDMLSNLFHRFIVLRGALPSTTSDARAVDPGVFERRADILTVDKALESEVTEAAMGAELLILMYNVLPLTYKNTIMAFFSVLRKACRAVSIVLQTDIQWGDGVVDVRCSETMTEQQCSQMIGGYTMNPLLNSQKLLTYITQSCNFNAFSISLTSSVMYTFTDAKETVIIRMLQSILQSNGESFKDRSNSIEGSSPVLARGRLNAQDFASRLINHVIVMKFGQEQRFLLNSLCIFRCKVKLSVNVFDALWSVPFRYSGGLFGFPDGVPEESLTSLSIPFIREFLATLTNLNWAICSLHSNEIIKTNHNSLLYFTIHPIIQSAIKEIAGEETIQKWHEKLVQVYGNKCVKYGVWSTLVDDGYIFEFLGHHLNSLGKSIPTNTVWHSVLLTSRGECPPELAPTARNEFDEAQIKHLVRSIVYFVIRNSNADETKRSIRVISSCYGNVLVYDELCEMLHSTSNPSQLGTILKCLPNISGCNSPSTLSVIIKLLYTCPFPAVRRSCAHVINASFHHGIVYECIIERVIKLTRKLSDLDPHEVESVVREMAMEDEPTSIYNGPSPTKFSASLSQVSHRFLFEDMISDEQTTRSKIMKWANGVRRLLATLKSSIIVKYKNSYIDELAFLTLTLHCPGYKLLLEKLFQFFVASNTLRFMQMTERLIVGHVSGDPTLLVTRSTLKWIDSEDSLFRGPAGAETYLYNIASSICTLISYPRVTVNFIVLCATGHADEAVRGACQALLERTSGRSYITSKLAFIMSKVLTAIAVANVEDVDDVAKATQISYEELLHTEVLADSAGGDIFEDMAKTRAALADIDRFDLSVLHRCIRALPTDTLTDMSEICRKTVLLFALSSNDRSIKEKCISIIAKCADYSFLNEAVVQNRDSFSGAEMILIITQMLDFNHCQVTSDHMDAFVTLYLNEQDYEVQGAMQSALRNCDEPSNKAQLYAVISRKFAKIESRGNSFLALLLFSCLRNIEGAPEELVTIILRVFVNDGLSEASRRLTSRLLRSYRGSSLVFRNLKCEGLLDSNIEQLDLLLDTYPLHTDDATLGVVEEWVRISIFHPYETIRAKSRLLLKNTTLHNKHIFTMIEKIAQAEASGSDTKRSGLLMSLLSIPNQFVAHCITDSFIDLLLSIAVSCEVEEVRSEAQRVLRLAEGNEYIYNQLSLRIFTVSENSSHLKGLLLSLPNITLQNESLLDSLLNISVYYYSREAREIAQRKLKQCRGNQYVYRKLAQMITQGIAGDDVVEVLQCFPDIGLADEGTFHAVLALAQSDTPTVRAAVRRLISEVDSSNSVQFIFVQLTNVICAFPLQLYPENYINAATSKEARGNLKYLSEARALFAGRPGKVEDANRTAPDSHWARSASVISFSSSVSRRIMSESGSLNLPYGVRSVPNRPEQDRELTAQFVDSTNPPIHIKLAHAIVHTNLFARPGVIESEILMMYLKCFCKGIPDCDILENTISILLVLSLLYPIEDVRAAAQAILRGCVLPHRILNFHVECILDGNLEICSLRDVMNLLPDLHGIHPKTLHKICLNVHHFDKGVRDACVALLRRSGAVSKGLYRWFDEMISDSTPSGELHHLLEAFPRNFSHCPPHLQHKLVCLSELYKDEPSILNLLSKIIT